MIAGTWFWILYVLALLLTTYWSWPLARDHTPYGLIYLLIGLLGWGVFGAPIR